MAVRLHPYARFTGTVYFDDLKVEKLTVSGINIIGGFEGDLPSYWTIGNDPVPAGATLEWATDEFRSLGKSLKITKAVTGESVSWVSENMADFWSPQHLANVDIKVGAWIRTEGVNTNPATEDEKWKVVYAFYDSAGSLIGETVMDLDQSTASSGAFYADTNDVGETILPEDSWTTIISFIGGNGAWAGQNWNTAVGVPTGWIYWLPPTGGNDGEITNGFENTEITDDEAYTGLNSLNFNLPFTRDPHDAFVGTKRISLQSGGDGALGDISALNAGPGDILRVSVMVKAEDLVPDSAALYPATWAVGFTYGFFKGNGNNDGWNAIDGYPIDMQFVFPSVTSFDWTQYYIDIAVPNDVEATHMAIRLHPYARFTGNIYFDDLRVQKFVLTESELEGVPIEFTVSQNYPNPFNPSTTINYSIPRQSYVEVRIYDITGSEVKTLVSAEQIPGVYNVVWNGDNNYGSKVATGIYIYRVVAGQFATVKKMILLK
jgi:hypothetical protein